MDSISWMAERKNGSNKQFGNHRFGKAELDYDGLIWLNPIFVIALAGSKNDVYIRSAQKWLKKSSC